MRSTSCNKPSQFICFADDLDIVGRMLEVVAEQYTTLKTKYFLAGGITTAVENFEHVYGHET